MKNSKKTPKPTDHLSEEAKTLWKQIILEYELDDSAGLLLLQSALEALDDMRKAQKVLDADGIVLRDRFGQPRQHPASLTLRDSRNLMLRCLKQLNLDIQPGAPLGK